MTTKMAAVVPASERPLVESGSFNTEPSLTRLAAPKTDSRNKKSASAKSASNGYSKVSGSSYGEGASALRKHSSSFARSAVPKDENWTGLDEVGVADIYHKHTNNADGMRALKPISLLPFVSDANTGRDDPSGSHVTSSSSTSSRGGLSVTSSSMLPVPAAMAEAISRQKKGTDGVRYWKIRHARASLAGGAEDSGYPSTPTTGQLPAIAHNSFQPTSPGLSRRRVHKARGQIEAKQQRRGSNSEAGVGMTEDASRRNIGQGGVVFSSSLGQNAFERAAISPNHPAPYPRSATTIDASVLLRLLPADTLASVALPVLPASLPTHPHNLLNPEPSASYPLSLYRHSQSSLPLADPTPKPILKMKLTQTLPNSARYHPLGQLPAGVVDVRRERDGEVGSSLSRGGKDDGVRSIFGENGSISVGELTCMQLTDTILGTKMSDLSRFYQLCQTKIRYVDFLERVTLRHSGEGASTPPEGPVRSNTWVPSLQDKAVRGQNNHKNRYHAYSSSDNGASGGSQTPTLNSLALTSASATSLGRSPAHALQAAAGTPRPAFRGAGFDSSTLVSTCPSPPLPSPVHIPPSPSGKPILKPASNPGTHAAAESPAAAASDSQLRPGFEPGLTWHGDAARLGHSYHSVSGRARPGTVQDTDGKKRAVRFCVSDQVREYRPGDPAAHGNHVAN